MATAGLVFLVVAFIAAAVSIVCLLAGQLMLRGAEKGSSRRQIVQRKAAIISRFGRLGVVLTFVAGLIPSRSASRKDPVEALRSE